MEEKPKRLTRRWLLYLSIALNFSLLAGIGLNRWANSLDSAPIDVVVTNKSEHPITDIHITHRRGVLVYVPNLTSGQEFRQTIWPTGGSNLRMSYRDHKKNLKVIEPGDVYAGTHQRAEVTIRIGNEGITAEQRP